MNPYYEEVLKYRQRRVVEANIGGETVKLYQVSGRKPVSWEEYNKLSEDEKKCAAPYPPVHPCSIELEDDIILDQDIAVKMRDGAILYTDILRPKTDAKVPVILAWSSYGKQPFYTEPEKVTPGVPQKSLSHWTKHEGPDPYYWCRQGYAVANVDMRGCGHSSWEGDATYDGYDFIEWVAEHSWCNGKVGMAGNSMLCISQWKIASTNPPHLTCIAPWEGLGDDFREMICEGGIPKTLFGARGLIKDGICEGWIGDMVQMLSNYPDSDDFPWRDSEVKYEKITVPAYVTGGWSHFHIFGACNGFRRISSEDRWFRLHRDFEWPDQYKNENREDLKRFFDRYLKGIYNGWEQTPKVRIEVMDAFDYDYQTNRPEKEFPLARQELKKLYLDARDLTMSDENPAVKAETSYDGETGLVEFDYTFREETELTGFMKLRLWVEARGYDDMDLLINVQKASSTGEFLPTSVMDQPHPGAWGKLRVSRRSLDETRSTDIEPYLKLDSKSHEKLKPGEVVPVDIKISPLSRIWHKGQRLRVQIAGRYIRDEKWFEPLASDCDNHGDHVIHTGGGYESYLLVPVIPPKYKDGDFIYR